MTYYRKLKPGWWGEDKPVDYEATCRRVALVGSDLPNKEAWALIGQEIARYRMREGFTRAERRFLKRRMNSDVWACRRELLRGGGMVLDLNPVAASHARPD